MTRWHTTLTAAVLSLGVAAPLAAQPATTTGAEAVTVATGFVPDPLVRIGATEGARPLRERAPGCSGFVTDRPSQRLRFETRFSFLRLFVVASEPVSLAVRGPDGQWTCAQQRRAGDRAPTIEDSFAPGDYEVWIGSTEPDHHTSYELHVTEFESWVAGSQRADRPTTASGRDLGLEEGADEGRDRGRRLRRGFLPDPREDGGSTAGSIDIGRLAAGCRGFVTPTPNHVLTLRNEFDYFRVQLSEVVGVAALVVRTPTGEYRCDAPPDRAPSVSSESWPEGDYLIWVSSTHPNTEAPYRICYTEVRPSGVIQCGQRPAAPDE